MKSKQKQCRMCNDEVMIGKTYCSKVCYDSYRRSQLHLVTCDLCGVEFYKPNREYLRSERHFCSSKCNNRFYNPDKNKTLMTETVRLKLSEINKSKGEKKSYAKKLGRHEHRRVAEEILGRPLKQGEVVHHRDENKRNNHKSNLIIFSSQSDHVKYHRRQEVMPICNSCRDHTKAE